MAQLALDLGDRDSAGVESDRVAVAHPVEVDAARDPGLGRPALEHLVDGLIALALALERAENRASEPERGAHVQPAGERKAIKTRANRRDRRQARQVLGRDR